jgi:hypothetical protein
MSSMYMKMHPGYLFFILVKTQSIALWNTAGAFDISKNMTAGL